jgi:putative nucleotidyltransferase with HDIG domain
MAVSSPEIGTTRRADAGDESPIARRALAAAFARAVDAKDTYTNSHSETVSTFCALIAERLGLRPRRVDKLRVAGMLHDVGKIGTPDRILQKPGPLTADEYDVVKQHPATGAEIVHAATLEEEAVWILHHHERMDGSGYPAGLKGEEIPLESRIILVADTIEAITSDRPYRKRRDVGAALEEIDANSGTQFDPVVVGALRLVLGRDQHAKRMAKPAAERELTLVPTAALAG